MDDIETKIRAIAADSTIHVCVPCYACLMRKEFAVCLLNLQALAGQYGLRLLLEFMGNESLITRARNILAGKFLAGTASHLLFIDADIVFDPMTVLRLLAADKPVACAVYPKKAIDWEIVRAKVVDGSKEHPRAMGIDLNINVSAETSAFENGFIRVLDAATGFMMIRRDAMEIIVKSFPDLQCVNDIPSSRAILPKYVAVFETMIDPVSRRYLSEDYAFCRRAQQAGVEIWVDAVSGLAHVGTNVFEGDISTRFAMTYSA